MLERTFLLADEERTAELAARIAVQLQDGMVIYLYGALGAGKTSFARALLRALGVTERIKSPTYSLMENYRTAFGPVWHLDLYRISEPDELEWLGLDALFDPQALVLVEWPEHGTGVLPAAELELCLNYIDSGRQAFLRASGARAVSVLQRLDWAVP